VNGPSVDAGVVRRTLWCVLLAANALAAGAMIVFALAFHRTALALGATAPMLLAGAFALVLWWDTCRPCRKTLLRALRWAIVAVDLVLVAHAAAAWRLAGRLGLLVSIGPLLLVGLLTVIVWRHRHEPTGSGRELDDRLPRALGGKR